MGSLGPGRAPVGSLPWILDGLGSGNERQGSSVLSMGFYLFVRVVDFCTGCLAWLLDAILIFL